MITIIQVILIVLLYSVYHVLSYIQASCEFGRSCTVVCPELSDSISITSAIFTGLVDEFEGMLCSMDTTTQVQALCSGSISTFTITYQNMGGSCGGQYSQMLFVDIFYDCIPPPAPPPCGGGQDYPSCTPCGNIYY